MRDKCSDLPLTPRGKNLLHLNVIISTKCGNKFFLNYIFFTLHLYSNHSVVKQWDRVEWIEKALLPIPPLPSDDWFRSITAIIVQSQGWNEHFRCASITSSFSGTSCSSDSILVPKISVVSGHDWKHLTKFPAFLQRYLDLVKHFESVMGLSFWRRKTFFKDKTFIS